MQCDFCETEPALLMVTNTENGETVAIGFSCVLPWAQSMVAELGGQAEQPQAELGGGQAEQDGPASAPAARPRKRRPAAAEPQAADPPAGD